MFEKSINKYADFKKEIDFNTYKRYDKTNLINAKYAKLGSIFYLSKNENFYYPIDFNFKEVFDKIWDQRTFWQASSLIANWGKSPSKNETTQQHSYDCIIHDAEFIALTKEHQTNYIRAIDLNFMGECYFYGCGVDKNINYAIHYWKLAAKKGFYTGMYNLAMCYYFGYGVTKNINHCIYCLEHTIEKNALVGSKELAAIYYLGIGVNKDKQKASEILRPISRSQTELEYFLATIEFSSLVEEIKDHNLTCSDDVKKYIINNQLGYKYKYLGQDNDIMLNDSGKIISMRGSLKPKCFSKLMKCLGIENNANAIIIDNTSTNSTQIEEDMCYDNDYDNCDNSYRSYRAEVGWSGDEDDYDDYHDDYDID